MKISRAAAVADNPEARYVVGDEASRRVLELGADEFEKMISERMRLPG